MKPFNHCAKPHKDILEGKFSLETYAAKIGQVYRQDKICPEEYLDPKTFFARTFHTKSFEKILDDVEGRLKGDTKKDSFNNITTQFGGGKTHTLIGLLHKSKEWNAEVIVLDAQELDVNKETLWGYIEKELDGKIEKLGGKAPPGSIALQKVFEKHQPLLILIDEAMHYVDGARAIKAESGTLANLTIKFFQQLTTAVSSLDKVCVVCTVPASTIEFANDEGGQKLYDSLKKVIGRSDKVITPIKPDEIPNVIRRRLFSGTDKEILDKAEENISSFADYCEREKILPEGLSPVKYRKLLERSYPFLPHVIDVLYENWGTIPTFQRTRGVLRLLSMVVHSIVERHGDRSPSFISTADFDLSDNDIQRELISHIDEHFSGIIHKDITSENSGAKRIDKDMEQGSKLGEGVATTIFMYSHSGDPNAKINATITDIKRAVCNQNIIPATIDTVIQKAQENLAFLHQTGDRFHFKLTGNLIKLKNDTVENLNDQEIEDEKLQLITTNLKNSQFDTYLFPESSKDVKDNTELKLVILDKDPTKMQDIVTNHGDSPRVNRNTIFFVCPNESDLLSFEKILKDKIAYQKLKEENIVDKENKEELKRRLDRCNSDLLTYVAKCYRSIWIPEKDGLKEIMAVKPSVGESISKNIYEELKSSEKINESLGPKTLKRMFLTEDYVDVKTIYDTFLRTPGEIRIKDKAVLIDCINTGVRLGEFGFGKLVDGKPVYDRWKENCPVAIESGEILINPEKISPPSPEGEGQAEGQGEGQAEGESEGAEETQQKKHLIINTNLPQSQSYNFSEIIPKIDKSFKNIQIRIECEDGEISEEKIEVIKRILKNMNARFNIE